MNDVSIAWMLAALAGAAVLALLIRVSTEGRRTRANAAGISLMPPHHSMTPS